MAIRFPLLAVLLVLLPVVALVDGFAVAPLAIALFLLMAAPRKWRNVFVLAALWPLIGSLWSIAPHASLSAALRLAAFIAMAGAVSAPDDERLLPLPAFGMVLAALLVFSECVMDGGLISRGVLLLHGAPELFLSKDINRGLCALAVLAWPAATGLAALGRRRATMLLPLLVLLMLLPLHSMSAKTGMIAGIAVFMLIRWQPVIRRWLMWAIPLAMAAWLPLLYVLGPWVVSQPSLYNRLPESSQHRLGIWQFAFGKWLEHPWLGWGADASRVMPGGLDEIHPGWVALPLHPHNMPLQILLEQGIIGYALFLVALTLFLRRAMVNSFAAAAIVAYLAIGLAAFNMWQTWWMATALVALLLFRLCGVNGSHAEMTLAKDDEQ